MSWSPSLPRTKLDTPNKEFLFSNIVKYICHHFNCKNDIDLAGGSSKVIRFVQSLGSNYISEERYIWQVHVNLAI